MCGRSTYLMTVKPPQIRTPRSVASPARASSPMGMLPPAVRERGLLRYSAHQRAPACFYTSYSVYLAAAGTRNYAPPPQGVRACLCAEWHRYAVPERVSQILPLLRPTHTKVSSAYKTPRDYYTIKYNLSTYLLRSSPRVRES